MYITSRKDDVKMSVNQEENKSLSGIMERALNKESIKIMELEDKRELGRREAFVDPKIRDLLRKLLLVGDKEGIIPVYVPSLGFVYQVTDNPTSENETNNISRDFLESLVELDILQKSFYDSVSVCPNCESTTITLHNRCPKCRSHNVEKTSLTEHIPCGYIDQRNRYKEDHCPKCGEQLFEGKYRNMGRWYVCQECGERFEHPEFDLICRKCNENFTMKEARVSEIPKFSLNLNRKNEIRQNVSGLEDIRTLLVEMGFSVEMPGLSIGQKSGIQHHFSLIAKAHTPSGQRIIIALDHAVSEAEVTSAPVILYVYKTSEVKVDIPIFVAKPKLNDTARKIAQGHDILLIEGSTGEREVINKIKMEIENRIKQKIMINEPLDQQIENKPETASLFDRLRGVKKKI
jgi:predicted RNA-binding Zn-ribbon protein involved in translation (DUF1610 family)